MSLVVFLFVEFERNDQQILGLISRIN